MALQFELFTPLFQAIDSSIIDVVQHGSAAMIALISPLLAICFSIYLLLIALKYWRGSAHEAVQDFFIRVITWAAILTFAMNATYYSSTVVPFFNGIGDEISNAVNGTPTTANVLDALMNKIVEACNTLYSAADGIEETATALMITSAIYMVSELFICIAAAYIILAKIALAILLALGPLFIALALFPATRKFFDAWVGQCMNYVFLTVLFSFLGNLQVSFFKTLIVDQIGIIAMAKIIAAGIIFILVSFNMPSLASALAGGVGISSMVGKALSPFGQRGEDKKEKKGGSFKGK